MVGNTHKQCENINFVNIDIATQIYKEIQLHKYRQNFIVNSQTVNRILPVTTSCLQSKFNGKFQSLNSLLFNGICNKKT